MMGRCLSRAGNRRSSAVKLMSVSMSEVSSVPLLSPIKGEFCHVHRGGNNPGVTFQCTGPFDCVLCGLNNRFWESKNRLVGQLLTLIDASVTDPRQNKAVKDIIKDKIIMEYAEHQLSMEMLIGSAMIHPQEFKKEKQCTCRSENKEVCDKCAGA